MSDHVADRALRLDEGGRIDEDLPCRACDYNLRGLELSAVCPECSTPVIRSARPDLLRFSDPAWLRRLALGMSLVVYGMLAAIAAALFMSVAVGLGPALGFSGGGWYAVWGTVSIATMLVPIVGVWLVTTPEPGHPEPDGKLTARRVARWCFLAQVMSGPLQMLTGSAGGWPLGTTNFTPTVMLSMTAGAGLAVVSLTGQAAGLVYFRRLALRLPHAKLARSTKVVTWGYMSSQGAGTVLGLALLASASILTSPNASMSAVMTLAGAGCTAAIGSLVFGIWLLVLLFRYRKAFVQAALQARRLWDAGL